MHVHMSAALSNADVCSRANDACAAVNICIDGYTDTAEDVSHYEFGFSIYTRFCVMTG